ncbi:MAG: hypothetical protein DWG74_02440, partial [Chloroflexi bacterium]|nr:hypothetical protein [Chloroflexota bacterium]
DGVAEAAWSPSPDDRQRRAIDELTATLRAAGLQAPRLSPDGEIVAYLVGAGLAVDCGDGLLLDADAFRGALATIVALLEQRENITLAEARDALATNRRSTQALLETLDRRGVTRRQGEGRVLGDAARARPA